LVIISHQIVFGDLMDELRMDGTLIQTAVQKATAETTPYVMVTHPGHHAAADSFGGYCYVNHVAAMAKLFMKKNCQKVAILDVDYHVGNGTASIFYSDPSVLVVSIHCDPDYEYPFHSGFADQKGEGEAMGTTLHLPLAPGTNWEAYSAALKQGLAAISEFGAQALIVSLGLDTLENDPVSLRRAGFTLQGADYVAMGTTIAEQVSPLNIPVIFLQEGGYRMDQIASAAANVVTSFCQASKKN
jgi:acetoin utilization deacetylase AcuC-like enzyme